ncbi:MAG: DUF2752 domain-containing protein [Myxococcota bacterium]
MNLVWLQSGRWWVLGGSALILVLAFTLTPSNEVVTLFGYDVPVLCTFRLITGYSCPGCGLTRSFSFLAHGHVAEAFQMNPLGPLLFLAVLAQLPWQIYRIALEARPGVMGDEG